jgi:hypothetical protein
MAERAPLPDFDLASLGEIAPEKLVSTDQATDLEAFMLAIALFYNDWKGLAWVAGSLLKPHQRDPGEVSALAGQLSGMNNHFVRLMVGMLHELLRLIREAKAVTTGREVNNLVASIPRASRDAWKDLLSIALENGGRLGPFGRALQRVRDSVSFHYYSPKVLVRGYQSHFFLQAKTPKNEQALYSLGKNMEGTRFYFADAAADAAMKGQATASGSPDFIEKFDVLGSKLNFALYSLLKQFIKERRLRGSSK